MSVTRSIRIGLVICALGAVGCGDDDGDGDNGGTADAAPDDFDATPATTHFGQSLAIQLEILEEGFEGNQGIVLDTTFEAKADMKAPVLEEMPGSPFACKVYEYTAEDFFPGTTQIETRSVDWATSQGTMQVSISGEDAPAFPPCNFIPGVGYMCPSAMGTGGDIGVADADNAAFALNDAAVTFGADELGRFVLIQGSGVAAMNGLWPIVMTPTDNTIVFVNPQCGGDPAACEEMDTAATYTVLAGMPGGRTPRVPNDAMVTWDFTGGGDGNVGDFSRSSDIADDFTLTTESEALMNAIPLNGDAFSIGCDGEGGTCNNAMASLLLLVTTDAALPPGPEVLMPLPETKSVLISCLFLSGTANVSEAVSAHLESSGATRVRALFGRANPVQFQSGDTDLQLIAGNAQAAFTTVE